MHLCNEYANACNIIFAMNIDGVLVDVCVSIAAGVPLHVDSFNDNPFKLE